ncbi:2,3-dehydroadipyl-CoA hydratase [Mycobacterium talmoniae]|uniref:2,3-dehydroadipyl-CoA hydratase n=1 Tax=Mycobacterium talmoniae TaxID=1858794 RepID=A0A2S8BN88_9MYCO|nr:2,3-dehydroadipyl-CoA hydratase [Mycobacterium talmoniae]
MSTSSDVVTIRLNRPDKRNAITAAMYTALADALIAAEASAAAVVVLTGAGGAFTAGNDLQDMRDNPPVGDNPPPVRFLAALTGLRAVLVAAVDGPAIGVGTTVLLHCDFVYATARSTFRLPFVDLGLVPEAASTLLLPRLVGHQRAAELMLFGERFDAATAANVGIVTAVVADGTALDQLLAERTAALVAKPRAALRATKALLVDSTARTVPARLVLDRRVLQSLLPPAPDRAHEAQ